MIQKVLVLVLLLVSMTIVTNTGLPGESVVVSPTLVLGFLLLSAYCFGCILEMIQLPRLTAYILIGLVFGPFICGFISEDTISDLSFINSLALSFIAFCAGGELKTGNIRAQLHSIVNLALMQTIIVFCGVSFAVYFILETVPFLSDLQSTQRLVVSLLFGVISVARSPSSTIAIISETKASGNYTDVVLSVTVVIDVVVIILFGITISFGQTLIIHHGSIDWLFFLIVLLEILVAFTLGFILGKGIVFLIEKVKVEFPVVMIGLGFLIIKFSHLFTSYLHEIHHIAVNFEPLLICMAAGFTVQNYSDHGRQFLQKMDRVSLPIYVVFFAITGASINLGVLKSSWFIGIIIVLVRLSMLYLGSIVSGIISKDDPINYRNYWLGFLTQAGVSLGLLAEIVRRFPSIGVPVQSLLVAAITINQLIGPIALKYALNKVGDANGPVSN